MNGQKTGGKVFLGVLILIMGSIWGLSFLATNIAVTHFEPIQTLTLRWTTAALVFLILAALGKVRLPGKTPGLGILLATGAAMPCVYGLFEAEGIRLTSVSESGVIIGSMPIFSLLIERLIRRKRPDWVTVTGIFVCFAGVVICTVLSPGFTVSGRLMGYVVLVVAVMAGAAYMHLSARVGTWYSSAQITAAMSLMGCVFFNVLNLVKGYGLDTYRGCVEYPEAGLACLFLGVLCSSLCYLLMNYVLAKVENTAVASNLGNSWTTVVAVVSGVVMGDPWGWYIPVGVALIVAGLFICARKV